MRKTIFLSLLFTTSTFASLTTKAPTELTVKSFDQSTVTAVDSKGKSYTFPRESVKDLKLIAGTTKLHLHVPQATNRK